MVTWVAWHHPNLPLQFPTWLLPSRIGELYVAALTLCFLLWEGNMIFPCPIHNNRLPVPSLLRKPLYGLMNLGIWSIVMTSFMMKHFSLLHQMGLPSIQTTSPTQGAWCKKRLTDLDFATTQAEETRLALAELDTCKDYIILLKCRCHVVEEKAHSAEERVRSAEEKTRAAEEKSRLLSQSCSVDSNAAERHCSALFVTDHRIGEATNCS